MNTQTNTKGFTIVELLIVIVVIAILAAISIVAYTGIQQRARNSSAFSLANQIAKKADVYYTIRNEYPTTAANFNHADNQEAQLEGLKVTIATGAAPSASSSSANGWFGTTGQATARQQFDAGNRVIYTGTANGYAVVYLKDSGVGTVTKGTAPTGTFTGSTNENV